MATVSSSSIYASARRLPCDRCGMVTDHECLMSFRTVVRPAPEKVRESNQMVFVIMAEDRYFETRCCRCNRVDRHGDNVGPDF